MTMHSTLRQWSPTFWGFVGKYGTVVALIGMTVGFSVSAPDAFPTTSNLVNVLSQISLTAIIAGGMTFPLAVGEFDLSIGYQASLAGVLAVGLQVNQGLPIPLMFVVVLAVGLLVGLLNGLIVTKLGVNALITTLGTGTIVVGMSYAYSAGIPIAIGRGSPFTQISLGHVLGVPNPILTALAVLVLLWVVLNHTDLGQHIQAVGGNKEAAAMSGVRVDRTKILAFMIAGFCAPLTGILLASRIGSGQITAGDGYLMDSFSACFLGSAALRDGVFHIVGTVIGVLTVGVGYHGLAIFGVPTFFQFVFKGALLIGAVALSTVARRHARARSRGDGPDARSAATGWLTSRVARVLRSSPRDRPGGDQD